MQKNLMRILLPSSKFIIAKRQFHGGALRGLYNKKSLIAIRILFEVFDVIEGHEGIFRVFFVFGEILQIFIGFINPIV